MKTINSPSGPYISVYEQESTFAIQLHRYHNVSVVLDKRVIPELILALKAFNDSPISPPTVPTLPFWSTDSGMED